MADTTVDGAWPTLDSDQLGPKQLTRYEAMTAAGVWDLYVRLATQTLERLVAYRVGVSAVTVRPVRPGRSCDPLGGTGPYAGPGMQPLNWNGLWYNVHGCEVDACEVKLPPPVGTVVRVIADGVVIAPEMYEVQNGHILVYTGPGPCPWSIDQDVSRPLTEIGTFGITYLNAFPVDEGGMLAVTLLALEFGVARAGGSTCRLPANATSIVRNGMAMTLVPRSFAGGVTNIPEVDAYVSIWNPRAQVQPSRVWSPDLPQFRTVPGPDTTT